MIGKIIQTELDELIQAKKWDELREALSALDVTDLIIYFKVAKVILTGTVM